MTLRSKVKMNQTLLSKRRTEITKEPILATNPTQTVKARILTITQEVVPPTHMALAPRLLGETLLHLPLLAWKSQTTIAS
jgi:hypothetical protein